MFLIKLPNAFASIYVRDYSNTRAQVMQTEVPSYAKAFESEKQAEEWAKRYLPGYNYKIVKE